MTKPSAPTRRDFLRNAALASGAIAAAGAKSAEAAPASAPTRKPNVLMICADQFRADFIGAANENPTTRTPHLNALARRGTMYRKAVCNQPLCSPSRSSFMTGRYATETGVWKLGIEPDHRIPTVADVFGQNGYETAFIGKWHVSGDADGSGKKQLGWVAPGASRGGFQTWEGANVLEVVSHPNHGSYWDNSGTDIGFKDEYRVDFLTDRAVNWLQQKHEKPWLLYLSQLEPHHQNDIDEFVAPERYKKTFDDPFVPADLLTLPGNWQSHLPGYYGCVQAIDDCVGRVVDTLKKTGQLDNTVIVFFSDHGCTFRTRMGEYKRSPHDSSIRVPFIVAGPGFDYAQTVEEVISLLDLTPTLLDAAGITPPAEMKGHSVLPLANSAKARQEWDSTAFVQISASMCGRSLRTKDWCYVVYDPAAGPNKDSHSTNYIEFGLYSIPGDPAQHTNLLGRPEYLDVATRLREELQRRIVAAGEPAARITPVKFYI